MTALAADEKRWAREGLTGLGLGWAIGTRGWMLALAKEHERPGLSVGLTTEERDALRLVRWQAALDEGLHRCGKSAQQLISRPMKQEWKLALAEQIRDETGASISWLAHQLHLGGADTLRGLPPCPKTSPKLTKHGQTPLIGLSVEQAPGRE